MGATLDALHRLQTIEDQIRSLRAQIESKRRAAQVHHRRLIAEERKALDTKTKITQAQIEADRIEIDRKRHDEHIQKLRAALNVAKTNKEYSAILTQLNTDKADVVKLEDQVLAGLSRVDELKSELAAAREALEYEQHKCRELDQAARDVEDRLADQLAALEAKRSAAAEEVPATALHAFERARDNYEGEAMASVMQIHPRRAEYICEGCNMTIPLETVNALQTRDDIQICKTCSRILYIDAPTGVSAQ